MREIGNGVREYHIMRSAQTRIFDRDRIANGISGVDFAVVVGVNIKVLFEQIGFAVKRGYDRFSWIIFFISVRVVGGNGVVFLTTQESLV